MKSPDEVRETIQAGIARVIGAHMPMYPIEAMSVCTCGEEVEVSSLAIFHQHVAGKVVDYLDENIGQVMYMTLGRGER